MKRDQAAPGPVDDAPTTKVNEARVALVAAIANDPARAAEKILLCEALVLSFDDRLREAEQQIDRLRDRLAGVELLQLRDGLQMGRTV